jgi:hypothetical protein
MTNAQWITDLRNEIEWCDCSLIRNDSRHDRPRHDRRADEA